MDAWGWVFVVVALVVAAAFFVDGWAFWGMLVALVGGAIFLHPSFWLAAVLFVVLWFIISSIQIERAWNDPNKRGGTAHPIDHDGYGGP